jgi:hypothetical protein
VDRILAKGSSQRKSYITYTVDLHLKDGQEGKHLAGTVVIVDGFRLFLNGEIKEICSLKAKQSIIKSLKVYNP